MYLLCIFLAQCFLLSVSVSIYFSLYKVRMMTPESGNSPITSAASDYPSQFGHSNTPPNPLPPLAQAHPISNSSSITADQEVISPPGQVRG